MKKRVDSFLFLRYNKKGGDHGARNNKVLRKQMWETQRIQKLPPLQ